MSTYRCIHVYREMIKVRSVTKTPDAAMSHKLSDDAIPAVEVVEPTFD
jgi:hypothetical protein